MRYLLLTAVLFLTATPSVPAANWSFWRGPEQNGVSRERDLPEKWSLNPKDADNNLIWAVPYGGITTPIIQDGQVYVINKVGEGPTQQERVMAFNADTGKKVWEHHFNVFLTDIVDERVGWTHLVGDPETGNVYSHGSQGFFICFSKEGKILWRKSMTEEYGRVAGYGGRVTSAIVDEDKVILGMVCGSWGELTVGQTRFVAFDKKTGDIIWWGSGGYRVKDTYYSTPVVAVIAGQRLLISGGGDGCVHAFKVRTGEKVWSYKFGDGAVNCAPVVQGDKVWIAHGEENEGNTQGRIICVDGGTVANGKPKLLWQVDEIKVKFASPILDKGRLYVCDDAANLFCMDADTGKEIWHFSYGNATRGSPVLADGKIYVSEVDSKFHILQPGDKDCKHLHQYRFRLQAGVPVKVQGSPAVVNGRVYFMTSTQLICIGKKGHNTPPDPIPPQVKEPPAVKGAKPAHLQIVPADVSLHPGESASFKAITYDDKGHRLEEVAAEWKLGGMLPPVFPIGLTPPKPSGKPNPPPLLAGELSETAGKITKLTAAKEPNGQFGRVAVSSQGLQGHARVRVVPVLPYVMDFKNIPNGQIPGAWINTQAKFAVATLPDGTKVLRKRNDNPNILVARAHAYIGSPDLKDYTIEAEVSGTKVRKDMPEIGVGANRYSLVLIGNEQILRLVTWDAQKRVEKEIPYAWKPGVWYHLKLTTEMKNGKGLIKGKVWARGEKEPTAWSVEIEDPVPNTDGAPNIYGFSTGIIDPQNPGTDIYFDNVKITPTKN